MQCDHYKQVTQIVFARDWDLIVVIIHLLLDSVDHLVAMIFHRRFHLVRVSWKQLGCVDQSVLSLWSNTMHAFDVRVLREGVWCALRPVLVYAKHLWPINFYHIWSYAMLALLYRPLVRACAQKYLIDQVR